MAPLSVPPKLQVALHLVLPARVQKFVSYYSERDEESDNHQGCEDHDDLAEEAGLKMRNPDEAQ